MDVTILFHLCVRVRYQVLLGLLSPATNVNDSPLRSITNSLEPSSNLSLPLVYNVTDSISKLFCSSLNVRILPGKSDIGGSIISPYDMVVSIKVNPVTDDKYLLIGNNL